MKEDHSELGTLVFRLRHEAAVHVGVTTRFEDQELADVIEVVERVAPLLEDGASAQRRNAAADDAKRFAGGVIVDGAHHQAPSRRRFAHGFMLTQPPSSDSAAASGPSSRLRSHRGASDARSWPVAAADRRRGDPVRAWLSEAVRRPGKATAPATGENDGTELPGGGGAERARVCGSA